MRTHCLECHGPDKQKNEIRFDTLGTDLTDRRTLEIWQDALDQLNLGEMPPKKAAQPERADTAKFIDASVRGWSWRMPSAKAPAAKRSFAA